MKQLLIKMKFTFLFLLFQFSVSYAQIIEGIDFTNHADVANTFDMKGADFFGKHFLSESFTFWDVETGAKIIALTTSRHKNSKIYQTHPQWTPDGKHIVFRSNRNAKSQFYAISMDDHEIVQITSVQGEASDLHLGWKKNVAYQFRSNQLIQLDLGSLLKDSEKGSVKQDPSAYEKIIATLPEGITESGGLGLDANENRIFFASRMPGDSSAIYSIDIPTGKLDKLKEVPFWANHLQANPWVSGEIMYSWETRGDAPQRIWYLSVDKNGKVENRPLYKEKEDEWVTHEVFMSPDHILFNMMGHLDRLQKNPTGIFSLNIRNGEVKKYDQAEAGGYWHVTGTKDGKWAVGDTFNGNLYRINLENGEATLLTTGHRPNSKGPFTSDAHSHHSISPDGKWVLFNSSMLTESDIMLVQLQPSREAERN